MHAAILHSVVIAVVALLHDYAMHIHSKAQKYTNEINAWSGIAADVLALVRISDAFAKAGSAAVVMVLQEDFMDDTMRYEMNEHARSDLIWSKSQSEMRWCGIYPVYSCICNRKLWTVWAAQGGAPGVRVFSAFVSWVLVQSFSAIAFLC
jgi:hypothetical protein